MNPKTLIVAALVWVAINAVVPLLVNSIERLFQQRIDRFVGGLVSAVALAAIRLLQGVLIVVTAPTIASLAILERVLGQNGINRLRKRYRWFNEMWSAETAMLRWDFPQVVRGRRPMD